MWDIEKVLAEGPGGHLCLRSSSPDAGRGKSVLTGGGSILRASGIAGGSFENLLPSVKLVHPCAIITWITGRM